MPQSILEKTKDALDKSKFHYQQVDNEPMLAGIISGQTGTFKCLFQAKEDSETLVLYLQLGPKAPPQLRLKIAEFVNRINYGLVIGNFEIDLRDGEMRFKNSICCRGGDLTQGMVYIAISLSIRAVNQFLPGFMMILFGGTDPKTAFQKIQDGTAAVPESAKKLAHETGMMSGPAAAAIAAAAAAKKPPPSGTGAEPKN